MVSMDSRKPAILRYAPTLVVAACACAVVLGIRTWQESDSVMRETSRKASKPAPGTFKSPYRELRKQQTTIPRSIVRKPVVLTSADELPISLEDARQFLAESTSFQRASTRAKSASTVIRRLCASGFTNEAFASIETEHSEAREAGISAFFLTARLNDGAILEKIRSFKEPEDAATAVRAYLKRLPLDSVHLLPVEDTTLKPIIREALTAHFREKLADANERDQALGLIEGLHSKGLLADELLAKKIVNEPTDVFTKWEQINSRISAPDPEIASGLWELVEQMGREDPIRALEAVSTGNITLKTNAPFLRPVLAILANTDTATAHRWYERYERTLTPAQRDDAAWIFAAKALESNLPDQVSLWSSQVKDPQTQERLARLLNTRSSPAVSR